MNKDCKSKAKTSPRHEMAIEERSQPSNSNLISENSSKSSRDKILGQLTDFWLQTQSVITRSGHESRRTQAPTRLGILRAQPWRGPTFWGEPRLNAFENFVLRSTSWRIHEEFYEAVREGKEQESQVNFESLFFEIFFNVFWTKAKKPVSNDLSR